MSTKNHIPRDSDFDLWWLMHQTVHLMTKAREDELKEYKLSIIHAAILFAIKAIGRKATTAEIARWTMREPHTITGILNVMEKRGLVKRVRDLNYRNQVRIAITPKGEKAYDLSIKRDYVHDIISSLSKEEQEILWALTERIRNRTLKYLKKSKIPPSPPFK